MFIHRKLCDAKCWIPVQWFSLADKSIKKSSTIAGLVKVEHSIDLQQSDVDYHAGWESEWLRWWSIFVNMIMLSLEMIFTVCRLNMQVVWRRSVCIALNLEGLLLLLIIFLYKVSQKSWLIGEKNSNQNWVLWGQILLSLRKKQKKTFSRGV